MAVDTATPSSRRAILAGALGGVAASVVSALGRPVAAEAADGDVVHVGQAHVGGGSTTFNTGANGLGALAGTSGLSTGVAGYSTSGTGVLGVSASGGGLHGLSDSATGARGISSTGVGVEGSSGSSYGVHATSDTGIGVFGEASASQAVLGISQSSSGVDGRSTSGAGVAASSDSGHGVRAYNQSTQWPAVLGFSSGLTSGQTGVFGFSGFVTPAANASPPKTGVYGLASWDAASRGVVGQAPTGTGVHGYAGAGVAPAPSAKTGVYGRSDIDTAARGVAGYSVAGSGVYGVSSSGTGVVAVASASTGYALKTSGRLSIARVSGIATIAAAATASAVITPGTDIVAGAYVLLTPQSDPGTRRFWATLDLTANTITIRTNATAGSAISVAWLLVG